MTAATTTRKPRTRKATPTTPHQIAKAVSRVRTVRLTRTLATAYLLTAVVISFTHIATLFGIMNEYGNPGTGGQDWQKWIAPVMIDTVAIIGKLSMSTAFTPATRKRGLVALWIAGSVSFAANIIVGYVEHMYGNAILGAVVVAGALWAEGHLAKMNQSTAK